MIAKKSKKLFGLVSTALAASILMQWLIIPKFDLNSKVYAADVPSNYDSANLVNYETILGGAVDYGIVADTLIAQSHTETSFATNHYDPNGQYVEVDYLTSTAHFIIGELVGSSNILFNTTRASAFYIEAPQSVFGSDYDPSIPSDINPPYVANGNIVFDRNFYYDDPDDGHQYRPSVIQAVNANASSNVNRLIDRIAGKPNNVGRSDFIHSRAIDNSYVLNPNGYCDYFYDDDHYSETASPISSLDELNACQRIRIDLTDSVFENRVVYINVPDQMVGNFNGGGVRIHKLPSTVVIFNFEQDENITLNAPRLYVHDGGTVRSHSSGTTPSNGAGFHDGSWPEDNVWELAEDFQNIIWNVRTTKTAYVTEMGGVMLFPFANTVQMTGGNSSGWIVAGHTLNMGAELHYLYRGGSSDVYGQMHFSLRKAFTYEYGTDVSVQDVRNVRFDQGDVTFNWYASDSTYQNLTQIGSPCAANENSLVMFPVLDFTSGDYFVDLPAEGATTNSRTFYFVVKENSCNIPGVSLSNGYINIALTVTRDTAGHFTYAVSYTSVNGDGTPYTTGGANPMSGIQFDLGAFYNLVDRTEPGQITLTKTIDTANGERPVGFQTYYFNLYKVNDPDDRSADTWYGEYSISLSANATSGSYTIYNLPLGSYRFEEIMTGSQSAERDG